MRNLPAICFLIAVAGNAGAADRQPVRSTGLENALAQASGWSNVPRGSRLCRDANGRTFMSDKPCEVQHRCYDDKGKLYTSASPCPRPREQSAQEMRQNQERAQKKREDDRRRLRERDPVAWKKLEVKAGGDLSQCQVFATIDTLNAICPKGQQSQSLR